MYVCNKSSFPFIMPDYLFLNYLLISQSELYSCMVTGILSTYCKLMSEFIVGISQQAFSDDHIHEMRNIFHHFFQYYL